MERVGQLSEILVTADDYVLDGRARLELVKELNIQPRIRYLTMHSGIGELPPGYDREWEVEQVRDVIEETGRGKWRDSSPRRQRCSGEPVSVSALNELARESLDELAQLSSLKELTVGDLRKFSRRPWVGQAMGVRFHPELRAHFAERLKDPKVLYAMGCGVGPRIPSERSYALMLCWMDYMAHNNQEEA